MPLCPGLLESHMCRTYALKVVWQMPVDHTFGALATSSKTMGRLQAWLTGGLANSCRQLCWAARSSGACAGASRLPGAAVSGAALTPPPPLLLPAPPPATRWCSQMQPRRGKAPQQPGGQVQTYGPAAVWDMLHIIQNDSSHALDLASCKLQRTC